MVVVGKGRVGGETGVVRATVREEGGRGGGGGGGWGESADEPDFVAILVRRPCAQRGWNAKRQHARTHARTDRQTRVSSPMENEAERGFNAASVVTEVNMFHFTQQEESLSLSFSLSVSLSLFFNSKALYIKECIYRFFFLSQEPRINISHDFRFGSMLLQTHTFGTKRSPPHPPKK